MYEIPQIWKVYKTLKRFAKFALTMTFLSNFAKLSSFKECDKGDKKITKNLQKMDCGYNGKNHFVADKN